MKKIRNLSIAALVVLVVVATGYAVTVRLTGGCDCGENCRCVVGACRCDACTCNPCECAEGACECDPCECDSAPCGGAVPTGCADKGPACGRACTGDGGVQ